MAIQVRRGNISDLDKGKLLPGEYACAMDKKRVFLQFGTTQETVLEMPTKENYEDMLKEVADSAKEAQDAAEEAKTATNKVQGLLEHEEDVRGQIQELSNEARSSADEALQHKIDSEQNASISAGYADSAAQSAVSAEESKAAAEQSALSAKASEEAGVSSAESANNNALLAKSYSDGKTGIREGEDTDCARFYKEKAEEAAEKAEQVTNISIATPKKAGIVKPDGTTITVDEDGTLRGADTVQVDGTTIVKTDENIIKLADALKKMIDNSVQQVKGKGLSANDFTDILLEKLNSIEEGAQVNPVPVNNLLATVPGSPLDSVQGKVLSDSINLLNADLTNLKGEYLQNTDIFAWAGSKKITSTCFAEANCLNTPGAGQGYAVSLFVSGGGIKNMYAVSGSTREVYVSIFNTVAWTAWKQVSYTTPQLFYMTLNSTYCESSYSSCCRLGNIAILSLYLNVRNISGYDKLLLATLPFKVINAFPQNCLLTSGERGTLYLESDGSLKFNANGASVTESAILTQMLAVIDE